ncbi:unnamed protein product [Staurois parvus]|uniref:Uncharacterized protein n=1 Tax=Staurois parvus TaxID=386267 RepID=A0ABN9C7U1_9NEOB|nr:unnamed protein product [Staurois parvus]
MEGIGTPESHDMEGIGTSESHDWEGGLEHLKHMIGKGFGTPESHDWEGLEHLNHMI